VLKGIFIQLRVWPRSTIAAAQKCGPRRCIFAGDSSQPTLSFHEIWLGTIFTYFTFLLVDFYLLRHAPVRHGTFGFYLNVKFTTLSNGYLGSRNDEERSEMRYVMRIAEFSESSNL
jgi:hypothetical protein